MTEHEQLVADCEARESRLSDWERAFVDSVGRQLAQGQSLTQKQIDRLEEIWERATS